MTIRRDVLEAAQRLVTRGIDPFTPMQIVQEARAAGSRYEEGSLRTHVVSYMCGNATGEYGGRWNDLVRIRRGYDRLASDSPDSPSPVATQRAPTQLPADSPTSARDEWSWEGNVQAAVVSHLAANGWRITRVADTASREHGVDIQAQRHDERLMIEVKGYPSTAYVRGPKQGQRKPTAPSVQARHWFALAMLTALLLADKDSSHRVVVALPQFDTYTQLARRTTASRAAAGIEIWLVAEDGDVRTGY